MVIVVEAVVALVLRGQLAVVGRDVVLEDAGVLVAVRLVEAGVEDVDGGVVALGLNAGTPSPAEQVMISMFTSG